MSRTLLVWDNPNINSSHERAIGKDWARANHPRLEALGAWLVKRARERSAPGETASVDACIFVNVRDEKPTAWMYRMLELGFWVYAKPKNGHRSDIDDEMVGYVRDQLDERHGGTELVAACHDRKCFRDLFAELLADGVNVTVLGFAGQARRYVKSREIGFVDLRAIPGLVPPRGRTLRLVGLPKEGKLLKPSGRLADLLPQEQDAA